MSPEAIRVWDGTSWRDRGITTPDPPETDDFILSSASVRGTKPVWNGVTNAINNVGVDQAISRTTVSTLTQVAGTAGNPTIIRDKKFTQRIQISASYQKFINCEFVYSEPYSTLGGGGMVQNTNANYVGLEFERCNFRPEPGAGVDYSRSFCGYYGANATFTRCVFTRCVDGIGGYNPNNASINLKLISCWVGQLAWFDDDSPVHNDGTHNDGIQHGSSKQLECYGVFWNGVKFNALNPGNITLTGDGSTYTIANGNTSGIAETDANYLYEEGKNGETTDAPWTSNKQPQQGQIFLTQHSAYFLVADIYLQNCWFWNGHVGVKASGAASNSTFGASQKILYNLNIRNNIFGGRWWYDSATIPVTPVRFDTNVFLNGVRRSAASKNIVDNAGNVIDDNLITPNAQTYGDGQPIQGNPIRYYVDLATTATS